MNKTYFYAAMKSIPELRAFSNMAREVGKIAVGITSSKNIYVLDEKNNPKKISIEEMANILGVDMDSAKLIVESKGNYQMPSNIVTEDSNLTLEAAPVGDDSAAEQVEEEPTIDLTSSRTETPGITILENIEKKLDKIVDLLMALFLE